MHNREISTLTLAVAVAVGGGHCESRLREYFCMPSTSYISPMLNGGVGGGGGRAEYLQDPQPTTEKSGAPWPVGEVVRAPASV